ASAGVVSFAGTENLHFNVAGNYKLDANDGTLPQAVSNVFAVQVGTATQLVVTTQPAASVQAGNAITITITAEDGVGNTDPNFTGMVTIAKDVSSSGTG